MKGIMKIIELNLNFGADFGTTVADFVATYVKDADVVVFTEALYQKENQINKSMVKLAENLEKEGFSKPFCSEERKCEYFNQIVIFAKENLNSRLVCKKIPYVKADNSPDFLHIEITCKGKVYQLIGTRVKVAVHRYLTDADYAQRKYQAYTLCKYVKRLAKKGDVIVVGDFNTGRMSPEVGLDAPYDADVKRLYSKRWDYKLHKWVPSALRIYNSHMLTNMFLPEMEVKNPIGVDTSSGVCIDTRQNIIASVGSGMKIDLAFFSKGLEVSSRYDWRYITEQKEIYKTMPISFNKYSNRYDYVRVPHGYPNHAMLVVEIAERES